MANYFDQFDNTDENALSVYTSLNDGKSYEDAVAYSHVTGTNTGAILDEAKEIVRQRKEQDYLKGGARAIQRARIQQPENLANETEFQQMFVPFIQSFTRTTIGTLGEAMDTIGTSLRRFEEGKVAAEKSGQLPPGPLEAIFGRGQRPLTLDRDDDLRRMHPLEVIGKGITSELEQGFANTRDHPALQVPQSFEHIRKDHFWGDLARFTISSFGKGMGSLTGIAATGTVGYMAGAGRTLSVYTTTYAMGMGEVRHALRNAGIKDETAMQRYTYLGGAVLGVLEAITPLDIMSSFSGEQKKLIAKYVMTRLAQSAGRSSLTEAVTEALQEGSVAIMVANATDNEFDLKNTLMQMADAGFVGFLTGGFAGGAARGFQETTAALRPDIQLPDSPPIDSNEVKEAVKKGVQEGIQETVQQAAEGTVTATAEGAKQAGVPEDVVTPVEEGIKEVIRPTQPNVGQESVLPEEAAQQVVEEKSQQAVEEKPIEKISFRDIEDLAMEGKLPENLQPLYNEYFAMQLQEPSDLGLTQEEFNRKLENAQHILQKAVFEYNNGSEQSSANVQITNLAEEISSSTKPFGVLLTERKNANIESKIKEVEKLKAKEVKQIVTDVLGYEVKGGKKKNIEALRNHVKSQRIGNSQLLGISLRNESDAKVSEYYDRLFSNTENINAVIADMVADTEFGQEQAAKLSKILFDQTQSKSDLVNELNSHFNEGTQQDNSSTQRDEAQLGTAPYGQGQRADGSLGRTNPQEQSGPIDPVDVKISTVVARLIQKLKVGARQGRMNVRKSVQGFVVRGVNAIRFRIPNDIETIAHEGGHTLQNRHPELHDLIIRSRAELDPLAITGDITREGFAEFFRIYINNRPVAEQQAPVFTQEFEALMVRLDPEMLQDFADIQDWIVNWKEAASGQRLTSEIVSSVKKKAYVEAAKQFVKNPFGVIGTWADQLYTNFWDKFNPLNNMVKELMDIAARNTGNKNLWLKAVNNPYIRARLVPHAYQAGHMDIMHGITAYGQIDPEGYSLRDVLVKAFDGKDRKAWNEEVLQYFGAYLAGLRLLEEWQRYESGDLVNLPSKLSKADVVIGVQDLQAAYPQFEYAREMLDDYMAKLLQLKFDAGMITQEQYDAFSQKQNYVPLMRDNRSVEQIIEDETGQKFSGHSSRGSTRNLVGNRVAKFKGSMRDIINPLESIARDTYETRMFIARNEVVKSMHRLALAIGPDGGRFIEEVPNTRLVGFNTTAQEAVDAAARQAGMSPQDRQMLTQTIDNVLNEDAVATIWRHSQITENNEHVLFYWENGQRRAIQLVDNTLGKQVFEVITSMGVDRTPDMVENWMALPARALRFGITTSLDFIGANFLRDQASAWILTEGYTPFVDGLKGIYSEVTNTELTQRMNRFGVIMGGANVASLNPARLKHDVLSLRRDGWGSQVLSGHGFFRITETSETGTRATIFNNAYEQSIQEGLTEYEAAVEAAFRANDYIDFSLHGSKTMMIRKIIPFFNAAMQGLSVTLRTLTGKRNTGRNYRDAISPFVRFRSGEVLSETDKAKLPLSMYAWANMVRLGFLSAALTFIHGDDPEYQDIPEYNRVTHWYLLNMGDGDWIRIPKPFELAFFANMVEGILEYTWKDDPTAPGRFLRSTLAYTVLPPMDPTVSNFFGMAANYDFFRGKEIVPQHLKSRDPESRYDVYTSALGRGVSWATNDFVEAISMRGLSVEPMMVDYAVKSFGGSWGRELLNASNFVAGKAGGPASSVSDYYFVRRFTWKYPRGSRTISKFWDTAGRLNGQFTTKSNEYKRLVQAGNQDIEAKKYLSSERDPEIKAYMLLEAHHKVDQKRLHPLNRAKQIGSMTNEMAREMVAGDLKVHRKEGRVIKLNPNEKREAIDLLKDIQNREMSNALKLTNIRGWSQRDLLQVEPIEKEMKLKYPQVYKEYISRHRTKRGKLVIRPFKDVQRLWPKMKEKLLDREDRAVLGY